ncbi:MAG: class I SAM-dependent methyltransferase [Rhizobiales bacterium]|nr:class I SAM-dependent methyltransferase [Hyphomicrobiales bacterium]
MTKTELGLPLEYQQMPQYFDAHNISQDAAVKNSVLEAILARHNVKSVLDLTCGTGSQVFYLSARGYQITGADFSPALLEVARKKAKAESISVEFIDADMRSLNAGKFDAAITMFNAVGHLSKADFEMTMRNICGNLEAGGIYVFDILNLAALNDDAIKKLAMKSSKTVLGTAIHHTQYSTLERDSGRLTSHDDYIIEEKKAEPKYLSHAFTLQIYTAKELRDMLAKTGFEVVGQYAMDGSEFLEHETTNILTVAKKSS